VLGTFMSRKKHTECLAVCLPKRVKAIGLSMRHIREILYCAEHRTGCGGDTNDSTSGVKTRHVDRDYGSVKALRKGRSKRISLPEFNQRLACTT
jgi:hypothetical protein